MATRVNKTVGKNRTVKIKTIITRQIIVTKIRIIESINKIKNVNNLNNQSDNLASVVVQASFQNNYYHSSSQWKDDNHEHACSHGWKLAYTTQSKKNS